MIIKYNKIESSVRDQVRIVDNRAHIGYVRYLLMRRIPFSEIPSELIHLGLSTISKDELKIYFEHVLYPVIVQYKLAKYYKPYLRGVTVEKLSIEKTFDLNEMDRQTFCACMKDMEIDYFFSKEVVSFYGSITNVPTDNETGEKIITTEKMPEWSDLLTHEKRHIIDGMLVDGKSPKSVSEHLDIAYDIQLPAHHISYYAKAFFKTKRRDLERTIDELSTEKHHLEASLEQIKNTPDSEMSLGARAQTLTTIKKQIQQLDLQIKRLTNHYSNAAYNEGILEYAQMREMFADVMLRTHRRYQLMDQRTEDAVIQPLNQLVGMMDKASKNMISLDEVSRETSKKSVVDEMLEVVMPSLERLEEEEREARGEYKEVIGEDVEQNEIIGMDE